MKESAPKQDEPIPDRRQATRSEFIETVRPDRQEEAARNRRNLVIAFGLAAFIVLIFVTSVVRMSSNYNAGV